MMYKGGICVTLCLSCRLLLQWKVHIMLEGLAPLLFDGGTVLPVM